MIKINEDLEQLAQHPLGRPKRHHAMGTIPGLYFIIAREDRARFVRPDTYDRLHTVGSVALTDLPETCDDAGGARGPPGSDEDCFLPRLARRISDDFEVDLFTHLVVVAPPSVLQELMCLIEEPTTAYLYGSLGRDLMTVPDLELWPHLLPWIQPSDAIFTSDVTSHRW